MSKPRDYNLDLEGSMEIENAKSTDALLEALHEHHSGYQPTNVKFKERKTVDTLSTPTPQEKKVLDYTEIAQGLAVAFAKEFEGGGALQLDKFAIDVVINHSASELARIGKQHAFEFKPESKTALIDRLAAKFRGKLRYVKFSQED